MKFKKASLKNIKEMVDIEWESGYKWNKDKKESIKLMEEIFEDSSSQAHILENKGLVGYFAVSFDKNKKMCFLNYFAIKKKYQGKGLSKIMIKKAIIVAKKEKCKEIELSVWGKNFPAIALYNKSGFYVTDFIKNKYPNGDNKLKMRKGLK